MSRTTSDSSSSGQSAAFYRRYTFTSQKPFALFYAGDRIFTDSPLYQTIHFHNAVEIGWCHSADGFLLIDGQQLEFSPDTFFIVPPYHMHTSLPLHEREARIDYLYYDPEVVKRLLHPSAAYVSPSPLSLMQMAGEPFLDPEKDPEVLSLIRAIFTQGHALQTDPVSWEEGLCPPAHPETASITGWYALLGLLNAMTEYLYSRISVPERRIACDPAVHEALRYINQHFRENIDPETLAHDCGISSRQLRSSFSAVVHSPIRDYIRQLRLDYACSLLLQTDQSILDIAEGSGFRSLSAFQKAFLSSYRLSPSAWRRKHRLYDLREVTNIVNKKSTSFSHSVE